MRKIVASLTALVVATACSSTATEEEIQLPSGDSVSVNMTEGERRNAEFLDRLSSDQLLTELKRGGYVIYFRHATTQRDYADQADPSLNLKDCSTQRKLSIEGIEEAQTIGLAFAKKEIPVGTIITSQYCRAWKTANFAFGRVDKKDDRLNFLPFENYTDQQVLLMKTTVMPLLSELPADGLNTVIVGHDDLFEAATGIYPEPQGIAYVLKPDGKGSFTLASNMLPQEWNKL